MRGALVFVVVVAVGCRALLGIDDPTRGEGSGTGTGTGSMGSPDSALAGVCPPTCTSSRARATCRALECKAADS